MGIITYMPGGMATDPRGMSAIGTNHAAMPMTQRGPMTPPCGRSKTGLSVRVQITIDGAPMEAFGKACIQGDGTVAANTGRAG